MQEDLPEWAVAWQQATGGRLTPHEIAFCREIDRGLPGYEPWHEPTWLSHARFDGWCLKGPEDAPRFVVVVRTDDEYGTSRFALHWRIRAPSENDPEWDDPSWPEASLLAVDILPMGNFIAFNRGVGRLLWVDMDEPGRSPQEEPPDWAHTPRER